jgi:prepilin-type N-terminal cleavage/methylation domain-containing protein
MNWKTRKNGRHRGFSLLELLVVILVIGVLAAMAIPGWRRMQQNARLSGDAHGITESLSIAKMRAAAAFTESRLFLYTGTTNPYFRIDVWNKTLACWVPDGTPNPVSGNCITTTDTTNTETFLSTGVNTGYGTISNAPDGTTISQGSSTGCRTALATGGTVIANASCIQFNSRGFPTSTTGAGFYVTDGTRVFGSTTNAMGLIHTYEIDASGSTVWNAQ